MPSWFRDYLTDRSQSVALQGSSSPSCRVTSGVPQGSILGPLLFILFFDGIFHLPLSPESNLSGYADDITYSRSISGPLMSLQCLTILTPFVIGLLPKDLG